MKHDHMKDNRRSKEKRECRGMTCRSLCETRFTVKTSPGFKDSEGIVRPLIRPVVSHEVREWKFQADYFDSPNAR
jgi:hypothetical protein